MSIDVASYNVGTTELQRFGDEVDRVRQNAIAIAKNVKKKNTPMKIKTATSPVLIYLNIL
jgi:hypothetical protein